MFLYDKTNILEGSGIFEVDFAPSHGPAIGDWSWCGVGEERLPVTSDYDVLVGNTR